LAVRRHRQRRAQRLHEGAHHLAEGVGAGRQAEGESSELHQTEAVHVHRQVLAILRVNRDAMEAIGEVFTGC
jgi:hypothetical protein